jgi:hypothetical protein
MGGTATQGAPRAARLRRRCRRPPRRLAVADDPSRRVIWRGRPSQPHGRCSVRFDGRASNAVAQAAQHAVITLHYIISYHIILQLAGRMYLRLGQPRARYRWYALAMACMVCSPRGHGGADHAGAARAVPARTVQVPRARTAMACMVRPRHGLHGLLPRGLSTAHAVATAGGGAPHASAGAVGVLEYDDIVTAGGGRGLRHAQLPRHAAARERHHALGPRPAALPVSCPHPPLVKMSNWSNCSNWSNWSGSMPATPASLHPRPTCVSTVKRPTCNSQADPTSRAFAPTPLSPACERKLI